MYRIFQIFTWNSFKIFHTHYNMSLFFSGKMNVSGNQLLFWGIEAIIRCVYFLVLLGSVKSNKFPLLYLGFFNKNSANYQIFEIFSLKYIWDLPWTILILITGLVNEIYFTSHHRRTYREGERYSEIFFLQTVKVW